MRPIKQLLCVDRVPADRWSGSLAHLHDKGEVHDGPEIVAVTTLRHMALSENLQGVRKGGISHRACAAGLQENECFLFFPSPSSHVAELAVPSCKCLCAPAPPEHL